MEKLLQPRLFHSESQAAFERLSGLIILLDGLRLLLPLPVPFSNAFPARAVILPAAAGLACAGAGFIAGRVQFVQCFGFFARLGLGGPN